MWIWAVVTVDRPCDSSPASSPSAASRALGLRSGLVETPQLRRQSPQHAAVSGGRKIHVTGHTFEDADCYCLWGRFSVSAPFRGPGLDQLSGGCLRYRSHGSEGRDSGWVAEEGSR